MKNVNPWKPMTNVLDLKHMVKLTEESGELTSAASRCVIQGIDEREPETGKLNRDWLEDEIADVLANIDLCVEHFNLDIAKITERSIRKKSNLKEWHEL